jgi:hypothetical protein
MHVVDLGSFFLSRQQTLPKELKCQAISTGMMKRDAKKSAASAANESDTCEEKLLQD